VEDPQGTTRVEIELTPNESRLRRHRSIGGGVDVRGHDFPNEPSLIPPDLEPRHLETGDVGDDKPPAPTVDRRATVVVGVTVAVISLFVGWALGRSGGSSAEDPAQPTAATIDTSPAETPPLAVVPSTVPVTVPVISRPAGRGDPTTSTVPEWQTTIVEVDPAAAALGLEVVMVGGTQIAQFDMATGEVRTLAMDSRISQPPVIDAGADWFVIRNFDSGVAQLIRNDGLPVDVPVLDVWSAHFQPDTGLFWQVAREYSPGASLQVVEVDHEGNETGRRVEIPGGVWPAAPDPAGGVVVAFAAGTYHVGPDGTRRLTTGNLVALSDRVAVVTDCGDDFSACGMYVVDRVTGARTQVVPSDPETGPLNVLDVQSPAFWGTPELMGAISPDDRWAPIVLSNDRQRFGLVDLTTGEFVSLGANPPSGVWWSPDGRLAIYNQSSRLMLFDTEQRKTTDIAPPGIAVGAFAVRPAV
jgi:hypothetical protein